MLNVNLKIKKGENIGIFGKTGSGKTTFINILMGILTPNKGNIFIDNVELFNQEKYSIKSKWKNNIALVPQDVFLYDSSIISDGLIIMTLFFFKELSANFLDNVYGSLSIGFFTFIELI